LSLQAYTQPGAQTTLPKVFLIGEHEARYLELSQAHPAVFISVFQNDLDLAYRVWSDCLMDIEDHASRTRFDLHGVKLWLNLYFNDDGTIAHLAFYPKPNSREVSLDQLVTFFKSFAADYQLPVIALKGFHHSTSVSFPTMFERTHPAMAKKN
jgi:hypothetical protein